jgi:hypothetical protein
MRWKVTDHPPYSPGLSPCDFHVFGSLKKALKGRRFGLDEDVKAAVALWFQQQPRYLFAEGIYRLVRERDACLSSHGEYLYRLVRERDACLSSHGEYL